MVAQSFARLPFFAGLPAEAGVPLPRARQAQGRAFPRMALPQESPEPAPPAHRRRDLRIRTLAADLLSRR
jgi:hypothetical protein